MSFELTKKVFEKICPLGSDIAENQFDVPPEERFWIIPGKKGPRWLIPQDKKYGLYPFLQWCPYDFPSRIKWKILYTAYCTGQMGLIPGIQAIGIAWNNKKVWQHIGWNSESMPLPVVYFGTPCNTRKAVAILVDSFTFQPRMAVKVPISETAAETIIREYNILCSLKQINPGIAPKPLFLDNESGTAVQEAKIFSPLWRTFSAKHWKYLEQLSFSNNATSVFEHSQKLLYILSKAHRIKLKTKVLLEKLLKECRDSTSLPQVFVHGDFAPWNIKKIENGSLLAIDWEMGDPNGIPLYDFFYFFLLQSYLFNDNFNENRTLKFLPAKIKKYPLRQIMKITLVSLALNIVKNTNNPDYIENFIQKIK